MKDLTRSIHYKINSFDLPEPENNYVTLKINDFGGVAGTRSVQIATSQMSAYHSFLEDDGNATRLPGENVLVSGINDAGTVVGGFTGRNPHAFVYTNGVFEPLNVPGASLTFAGGINNLNQIVGSYYPNAGNLTGFLETNGTFTTIAVPEAYATRPAAVNDLGQIVGAYTDSKLANHGFLYSNGKVTTIDVPGAFKIDLNGIDDLGEVVGSYALNGQPGDHGFIYMRGKLASFDVPGSSSTDIDGINNLGQIIGYYRDATGGHGFIGDARLGIHLGA